MLRAIKMTALASAICLPGLSSCHDEIAVTDLSCELQSIQHQITADSIRVDYRLEGTGIYQVSYWSYISPSGEEVVVNNPEVPSNITLHFTGQASPMVKAAVKVSDGSVKVSYKAWVDTTAYVGIDQCIQQINP